MTETLLTVSEVADRLGFAYSTVAQWCRQGRFPNARPHGERIWLIPERDLTNFQPPPMGRPKKEREEAKSIS